MSVLAAQSPQEENEVNRGQNHGLPNVELFSGAVHRASERAEANLA